MSEKEVSNYLNPNKTDIDNLVIMPCEQKHYQEFLQVINESFGFADKDWFSVNVGHCCPRYNDATPEEIRKNLIAVHEGKIIGALGVYPTNWRVTDGEKSVWFKVAGVGQVCCLKEHRGNGIMSKLIRHGLEVMSAEGCQMSWLQGDRFRYKNYGWDFGGGSVKYHFTKRSLAKTLEAKGLITNERTNFLSNISFHNATISDVDTLNILYSKFPSYTERSDKQWRRHITRDNLRFVIASTGDKAAYCVYRNGEVNRFPETIGDPDCMLALIKHQMDTHNIDEVTVDYPQIDDAYAQLLYNASGYYSSRPMSQINILDAKKCFEMLLPFLEGYGFSDIIELTESEKLHVCKKLLLYNYILPEELKEYKRLKPLTFWLPDIDDV